MSPSSVLVAEHDPMQRQLIDLLFTVDGYDLTVVSTGEEALAHLREHTPSAVILAADLPDVPGTTICQKLKAVRRLSQVPVILVAPETAGGVLGDDVRRAAHDARADLVVQKPLGDKNLRERVQRLMAGPRDAEATPAAAFTTAALEFDAVVGGTRGKAPERPKAPAAATELGGLRAEVARLREENDGLKLRLTKYKHRVKELQEALEEERRRPRGLFGRRS
jgi:DNA-binding response OmpR family regulator